MGSVSFFRQIRTYNAINCVKLRLNVLILMNIMEKHDILFYIHISKKDIVNTLIFILAEELQTMFENETNIFLTT